MSIVLPPWGASRPSECRSTLRFAMRLGAGQALGVETCPRRVLLKARVRVSLAKSRSIGLACDGGPECRQKKIKKSKKTLAETAESRIIECVFIVLFF